MTRWVVWLVAFATGACTRDHAPASTEARRVVSLGPATTEALFAIGAGDRVVARSRYCDWPPEAQSLPAVGGLEPDVEAILQLAPDLVVGPSGQWSSRVSSILQQHGIATWFPDEIRTLAGVDAMLVGLGERTGHAAQARALGQELDARERTIAAVLVAFPPSRVLFVVGVTPVVAAGPDSFADDLLRHAGAVNALTAGGAWPTVGLEKVVEVDPDVVVDASVGEGGVTRITLDAPGWGGVRAVREGHVVVVTDKRVLRPGPRIAEGLAVLAQALHPGLRIPP